MSRADDGFREFAVARTPSLLRSALALCGQQQTAEDLTQDTLVKVYLVWGKRRIDNPAAYAHTTLVRTFLSAQRRRSARERPVADVPEARAPGSTEHDTTEIRVDLTAALARLSPTDRAVLVLRFLDDLSVADTARALRLTDQAVRSRTQRALTQVRGRFVTVTDARPGGCR